MAWLTTDAFHSVDRLLEQHTPAAAEHIRALGPNARALLRYEASEQNRSAFETWEYAQLAFGAGLFMFLLFGSREGKLPMILVLLMLSIVLAQRILFTPVLASVGRDLDFAAPGAHALQRQEFRVVHTAYIVVEVVKWIIGLGLGVMLGLGKGRNRSGDAWEEIDPVDKRNYRHVNR